jgi:hypothetical protein
VRRLLSALVIAAAAVVSSATPALADDTVGPEINWAHSVEDDLGRIQVGASSEAGVTDITAHLISDRTGAEVAVVTAFHLSSGTATDGIWESDEVILPDLGAYRLNVEASDSAGGHSTANGIGDLNYAVAMSFTGLKTTPTVSYTQRTYKVSGQLMGLWPGTRATAPIPAMSIYALIPGGTFAYAAPTDAKGRFSLSGPVTEAGGFGYLSTMYNADQPFYLQAYTDLTMPRIKTSPTKVTIHLDRRSIVSQDPVTVSGDATWKSPDGWVPMANARIAIGQCPRGVDDPDRCFSGPTTSTDANGHYSYVINPYDTDLIMANVSSDDIYVQSAAMASAKITVLMRTSFGDFSASRDPVTNRVVINVQGLDQSGYSTDDTVVSVQFSENGTTGWHTIGTIDLGSNAGSSFEQAYDPPDSGYWRVTYAGEKGLFEPAQTNAIYVA